MSTPKIVSGVLLVGTAAAVFVAAGSVPLSPDPNDSGPALLPRLVALALAGLAIVQLFHQTEEPDAPPAGASRRVIEALAVVIAYVYMLPHVGFLVATPVFLAALQWLLRVRRPLPLILAPLIATVTIHIVFAEFLNIRLPIGYLERLL